MLEILLFFSTIAATKTCLHFLVHLVLPRRKGGSKFWQVYFNLQEFYSLSALQNENNVDEPWEGFWQVGSVHHGNRHIWDIFGRCCWFSSSSKMCGNKANGIKLDLLWLFFCLIPHQTTSGDKHIAWPDWGNGLIAVLHNLRESIIAKCCRLAPALMMYLHLSTNSGKKFVFFMQCTLLYDLKNHS